MNWVRANVYSRHIYCCCYAGFGKTNKKSYGINKINFLCSVLTYNPRTGQGQIYTKGIFIVVMQVLVRPIKKFMGSTKSLSLSLSLSLFLLPHSILQHSRVGKVGHKPLMWSWISVVHKITVPHLL
jgi:hypothetical protein